MATFASSFVYTLDQNGNSSNGKITALIGNSSSVLAESDDDGKIQVGDTFGVVFADHPELNGTYTYVGWETDIHAAIGRDAGGNYFLFSNDDNLVIGSNLTTFSATEFVIGAVVCYAAGTRILTPTGERPIEDLKPGDLVATLSGSGIVPRPVRWIGRRRIDLTAHPQPDTVAPIRILRDAIADNVPHADLLVSPAHGVLVNGKLVCAHQLVNGATIHQEMGRTSIIYYHVELDAHAILLAEGAPAESYLDTGNRGFFGNAGVPIQLHPDLKDETEYPTREASSCVPFVWDEATVRPIWQTLAGRAHALGLALPEQDMTNDPALCISTDGRTIPAMWHQDERHVFVLPPNTSTLRLQSRAARPTEGRPWLNDQRLLGVQVAHIVMRWGDVVQEIPLDHPSLSQGWWAIERSGDELRRWTNGDALLPLPACDAPCVLEIHAGVGGLTYPINEQKRAAA